MIYPYKCNECDRIHEIKKPMDEAARDEYCPDCGAKLQRIFTYTGNYWGAHCWNYDENTGDGKNLILTHHD
jgi:putative FmdB family regulatory protein